MKFSDVTFSGKSGTRYRFQVWSLETRFRPVAAMYIVTRRAQDNGTYNRGSHDVVYIGETGNLADPFATGAQFECFRKHDANCICIHQIENEHRRIEAAQDLSLLHPAHCDGKSKPVRNARAAADLPGQQA